MGSVGEDCDGDVDDSADVGSKSTFAVDADGFDDVIVGAYHNDAGGSNAGAACLLLGHGR